MDLLARALDEQTSTALAATLQVRVNVFSKAREREHLSPILSARIAGLMGEDVMHWIAIAALEAERPSPDRDGLLRTVRREVRKASALTSTLELLRHALAEQTNTALSAKLHIDLSLFSQARKRGRLSPILAGRVAGLLGENVTHWIAVAALEAARPGTARDTLLRTIRRARGS